MRKTIGIALLILGCIFAAACGSSSSSSSSAGAPSTGSAVASSTSSSSGSPYSHGGGSSASAGGAATKVTTKHTKFGTILAAGHKQLTVYMFEADKGAASKCGGACAGAWPPVIARGSAVASGQAMSADVGTITRSGGIKQVTYKGHPLYYFMKDKDDGDAYGQGVHAFGAGWYVVAPNGNKVDNS